MNALLRIWYTKELQPFRVVPALLFSLILAFLLSNTSSMVAVLRAAAEPQVIANAPAEPLRTANIHQTDTAPTIDGVIDAAWNAADYNFSNRVILGSGTPVELDLQVFWRGLYDTSNIYILIEVKDSVIQVDSGDDYWLDDGVELYLDGNHSQGASYDGVDDIQISFRWNDTQIRKGPNSINVPSGLQYAMQATSEGYLVELSLPLNQVNITPSNGTSFGIDVHGNDDDDGGERDHKVAWNATSDDAYIYPSSMGTGIIVAQPTQQKTADINSISAAPIIDGSQDGIWLGATAYPIPNVLFGSSSFSTSDISGSFRILYDAVNLYIFVAVTDDDLWNDSGPNDIWQDDVVEIYIDGNYSRLTSYDEFDDRLMTFRWNDNTAYNNFANDYAIPLPSGLTFAQANTSSGYNLEISVPLSQLGITATQGYQFGLEIALIDDDNGGSRDGKLAWNETIDEAWRNPSYMGTGKLGAGVVQPPGNTSPVLVNPGNQSNTEGDSVNLGLSASDVDVGDVLTFSATGLPPGLTVSGATIVGTVTSVGTYNVFLTVNDGEGGSDSASFIWTVSAVNVPTGWYRIEDFESLANGLVDGQNGWASTSNVTVVGDPEGAPNKVLSFDGFELHAYKALPQEIPNSATGTVFFRMRRSGTIDAFGGASDGPPPNEFNDYEIQFGGQQDEPTDFRIRNGSQFAQADGGFQNNTWYCVWLVADNAFNTYSAYVQGGQYDSRTRVNANGLTTFSFRNGGTSPLTSFFNRTQFDEGGIFYIDDAYVDPGQHNQGLPSSVSCPAGPAPPTCYPLSLSTIGNGADLSASPTNSLGCGFGQYVKNEIVSLTASPASGWQVNGWTGTNNNGSTSASNQVTMPAATHSASVSYTSIPYTIQVSVNGNGTVTLSPAQANYTIGDKVTLTATPGPNYTFANWSGNASGTAPSIELTVNGNLNVTATFTEDGPEPVVCHRLARTVIGNGAVIGASPPNSVGCDPDYYKLGEVIGLTAGPATGWQIERWAGTADDSATTGQNSVTMPNDDHAVSVSYVATPYSLTVNVSGNGSVSRVPDQPTYIYGDIVLLTATPASGSTFGEWGGDLAGIASPIQVTIARDTTVTANFLTEGTPCHPLTMANQGGGSPPLAVLEKSTNCPTGQYVIGEQVGLMATPQLGWKVSSWLGTNDDTLTSNTNTTTMIEGGRGVTVTYSALQYAVTIESNGQGSIQASPQAQTYAFGDLVALTAAPANSWAFAGWQRGDEFISTENPFSYTVTSEGTVTGLFVEQEEPSTGGPPLGDPPPPVFLTVRIVGSGTVNSVPEKLVYLAGDTVELTAVPADGWRFVGWETDGQVSGQTSDATTSITLDKNTVLFAVFEQDIQRIYLSAIINGEGREPNPPPTLPSEPTWELLGGEATEYSDIALTSTNGQMQIFVASRHPDRGGIANTSLTDGCTLASNFRMVYTIEPVFSLAFMPSNSNIAVAGIDGDGIPGTIYTANGGLNWFNTSSDIDNRGFSVVFGDDGAAYAIGDQSGFYASTTNGQTWNTISDQFDQSPNFVRSIGPEIWLGTDGGGVLRYDPSSPIPLLPVTAGLNENSTQTWDLISTERGLYLATADGVYVNYGSGVWQRYGLNSTQTRSLVVANEKLYAGTITQGVMVRDLSVGESVWEDAGTNPGPREKIRALVYVESCGGILAAAQDGIWLLK